MNPSNHLINTAGIIALLVSLITVTPAISQDDKTMPPDTSNWAAIGVIDVHAHIGSYEGYDLRTETLMDNLNRFGIELALISNIDGARLPGTTRNLDEVTANRITKETVQKYPNKLRGLVWSRPTDGSAKNVEPFLRDHHFVGVKLHPEMNQFPADSSVADPYMALCEKYKVPAVFHCGDSGSNSEPQKIYALAKRHRSVPVVLYHMGFKGPHEGAIATVKESIARKDAQLYLETSQANPDSVLKAIAELGADHVLFGTDATYYGQQHYEHYVELVRRLKDMLSAEDFAKVMRGNAKRIFRL